FDLLGHVTLLLTRSTGTDFDLLRPIRFQPFQLDLQDSVVEACLDFVGIDPKRKLHRPRKTPVSALAALPVHVLLLGFWFALARERQDILLQLKIYVIAGDARQFRRDHDTVFAEPDISRYLLAESRGPQSH